MSTTAKLLDALNFATRRAIDLIVDQYGGTFKYDLLRQPMDALRETFQLDAIHPAATGQQTSYTFIKPVSWFEDHWEAKGHNSAESHYRMNCPLGLNIEISVVGDDPPFFKFSEDMQWQILTGPYVGMDVSALKLALERRRADLILSQTIFANPS